MPYSYFDNPHIICSSWLCIHRNNCPCNLHIDSFHNFSSHVLSGLLLQNEHNCKFRLVHCGFIQFFYRHAGHIDERFCDLPSQCLLHHVPDFSCRSTHNIWIVFVGNKIHKSMPIGDFDSYATNQPSRLRIHWIKCTCNLHIESVYYFSGFVHNRILVQDGYCCKLRPMHHRQF